jgi:serine/threonine-protein kinase
MHGLVIEPYGDATLVEELIEGTTLRVRMSSAIETPQALDLIARIAFALSAIHSAGVVHCDLKPENLILSSATRPVIVDFGVALLDPNGRTRRGSPEYMAPEQKRGARSDARTDLYALGIIAHELLGIEPAAARKFLTLRDRAGEALRDAGVEPRVAKLIRSLVAPMKWLRPRSAAEVGQIIARGS